MKGVGGVVYPRLARGSRIFWRDIHSVTGMWISGLALFLLLSGLPWAKFWGDYLKTARRLANSAVATQDWTNGAEMGHTSADGHASSKGSGQRSGGWSGRARGATPSDLTPVDRIIATIQPLELLPPVVISPPARGSSDWTAKSTTANRPYRVRPGGGWENRGHQGPQGFSRSSTDRSDRRNWNRSTRGTTLRLAQSIVGAHHGGRLGVAEREFGGSVVATSRRGRSGSPKGVGETQAFVWPSDTGDSARSLFAVVRRVPPGSAAAGDTHPAPNSSRPRLAGAWATASGRVTSVERGFLQQEGCIKCVDNASV